MVCEMRIVIKQVIVICWGGGGEDSQLRVCDIQKSHISG